MATALNTARTQYANVLHEQLKFLRDGGTYQGALLQAQANGLMSEAGVAYVHQEYPKMIYISKGMQTVSTDFETIKGKSGTWTREEEQFDTFTVNSAAEERAVLKGEPVSALVTADPVTDEDSIEALEARLAVMKRKAAVRKELAELAAQEAQAAVAEAVWSDDEMKEALIQGGHKINPKWTPAQLAAEFNKYVDKA